MRNLRSEREIIQSWKGDVSKPLVSICCITYNHENYIEDALKGFLIQKTDFPFEILIHDDASTDKTAKKIREYEYKYPNLIKPIYQKENQYSKGKKPGPEFNFPRAKGDYIAMCEGDDFWINPLKLRKQVEFLESNKEYSFCFHRFVTRDEKNKKYKKDLNGRWFTKSTMGCNFDYDLFCRTWHIGLQTLVFRRDKLILKHRFKQNYRDVFLISDLLYGGKGYCLNNFMAVYRIHNRGIYSRLNRFQRIKTGYNVYKEIFMTYRGNYHLKRKYERFSYAYLGTLLKRKKWIQLIKTTKEHILLTKNLSLFLLLFRDIVGLIKNVKNYR